MEDVMPSQVKVEVAGGFVDPIERSRAQAMVASVCRRSRSARGRVVLCARTDPLGSATASADAILVLDGYRLLCAGAVGASTRDAIDELGARLYRQVGELGSGNRRCASSSGADGAAHELARAGKPRSWRTNRRSQNANNHTAAAAYDYLSARLVLFLFD